MPRLPPGGTAARAQRPVADDPGTEQRRRLLVGQSGGQPVCILFGHQARLGVPAVDVPAGERRVQAQVLRATPAEPAPAVGAARARPLRPGPRRANRAAPGPERLDRADDLVAGGDVRPARRQVALGQVEVGAADAAAADPYPQLAGPRLRHRPVDQLQRTCLDRTGTVDDPRSHRVAACSASCLREPQPAAHDQAGRLGVGGHGVLLGVTERQSSRRCCRRAAARPRRPTA